MVPGWTAMMARVPASASPTVRVCGKGRRVPPSGLPQYCRFSGVSGTSIITPSRAMTRQWRIHAPGVPGFATGTATRSNSTFIGSAPSLFRAWDNALVVGTFHSPLQTRAKRRPLTSLRITSSYPSVNNANARTKYTTTCAGSVRDLFSRDCVSVRTSSTMNLGTVRVRVPSVTWSVSFPGFPVSIPLIIIEWLVIDGGIDVSTRRTIFSEYTQWESWNRRSCLVAVRTGTSSADQSGTEEGSARGRYRVAMVLRRSVGTCASTGLTTRHWTRVCHVDEGFDFLGWHIQRRRMRGRNGKKAVYTYPSKKALVTEIDKVRSLTRRAQHRTLADLLHRLNPVLRGWCNYFRHGVSARTFSYLDHFAFWRVFGWLTKRHAGLNKRTLVRRFLPGWEIRDGTVEMFRPQQIAIERYRYRGTRIPTPWSSALPAASTAQLA